METFGVVNYFAYIVGTILIVLLPGPNSLYVLSLAAQQGQRRGWAAAMGIFVGDGILMTLTAAGAVSVLIAYPALFFSIKLVGALYLTYLGIRLILSAWKSWYAKNDSAELKQLKPISASHAFNKALLVSLLNPKAILFFLSFFVQFVDPSYSSASIPFLILAITLQIISLGYLGMLIYAGAKLAHLFRQYYRLSAASSAIVGLAFISFALKLALASIG